MLCGIRQSALKSGKGQTPEDVFLQTRANNAPDIFAQYICPTFLILLSSFQSKKIYFSIIGRPTKVCQSSLMFTLASRTYNRHE